FQSGREWTEQMRDAYRARFNTEPPFDIWGIHVYDLDWEHLPNGNAQRQIQQIDEARGWLDSIPELAPRPLWLTEVGIHWGYPGYEVRGDQVYPTGEFQEAHVEAYMRELFGWLNQNAQLRNIARWFLWVTYISGAEQNFASWGGISLMDGPTAEANITR